MPLIILASTSPYRQELLQRLKIPFQAVAPLVDEAAFAIEAPVQTAQRLAQLKASAVASVYPQAVVIGSDQVADLNGKALNKPMTHANAVRQLQQMSGKTVQFHTAVSLYCQEQQLQLTELVTTAVEFRHLSIEEINQYLLIEQPYDCAGSAKCEGLGISLLQRINTDDPTALIGLPLIKTSALLRQAGISFLNYC